MPSVLPDGEPVPTDGSLPAAALQTLGHRPFGVYVHVPFCPVRCGYCDFNTYTADRARAAARRRRRTPTPRSRDRAARRRSSARRARRSTTVFFGGGTPTLLPAADLAVCSAPCATVRPCRRTPRSRTEANPDSVTPDDLAALRAGGFTRISFGMQSAVPSVLAVLDRTHDPERVPQVVAWARAAGFEQISLDLIYGTPGESLARLATLASTRRWPASRTTSRRTRLIVEDGTALARQVRSRRAADARRRRPRRQVPPRRRAAHRRRARAGTRCRTGRATQAEHAVPAQRLYWTAQTGGASGPGRTRTSGECAGGTSSTPRRTPPGWRPALARRTPGRCSTTETRRIERVLLELRLRDGLPLAVLTRPSRGRSPAGRRRRLGTPSDDRLVLTLRGRLLADAVVRTLLP